MLVFMLMLIIITINISPKTINQNMPYAIATYCQTAKTVVYLYLIRQSNAQQTKVVRAKAGKCVHINYSMLFKCAIVFAVYFHTYQ